MKPILYEQNEQIFDTNGIGILDDTISSKVTEVRNSEFELELKYPIGGEWAKELTQNRYILVKPNDYDEPHAFRIYETEKEIESKQIIVKAVTKTEELSGNIIKPISIKSAIPSGAWEQIKRVAVDPISYNFISDIQTSKDTSMEIRNVLNAILGEEGSFVDTWGGEIKRTNNTIYLYSKRGRDHVTTIRPRKNLKNVKVKSSMAGKFTRILPYIKFTPEGENKVEQIIYGDIIKSPHYEDYFVKRIVPLDLSSEFNDSNSTSKESKKPPTTEQITAKAKSYFTSKNKDADKPDLIVEVDMLPLQDSTEWDRRIIKALEKIQLCDTVDVYVPKIDCDVTVKVRKIVYDTLAERIIKIEASSSGYGRSSLSDQQKAQWQDLTNKIVNNALYGEKDGLIHTILTSANNKNKNFYGSDEPSREKVSKDDLWFKPIGSEGEIEMWRFDGEQWVLIMDSNFEQKVSDKVNDAIASTKEEINNNLKKTVDSAISDAEKRWKPDLTPLQNQLDERLRVLDGDINVKISDLREKIKSQETNLSDLTEDFQNSKTELSLIPGKISSAVEESTQKLNGEISKVNTSIEQKANEIKIAASNLESKVNENAQTTSSELTVLKDSISTKVSKTELDIVSGKINTVETNVTTKVDGVITSINNLSKNIDDHITSSVNTKVTQEAGRLESRISTIETENTRIVTQEIPDKLNSAKRYSDTLFGMVDGKIQTQISSRLVDYARTSDVATRITQEAGKIRTELSSSLTKIPKKYGIQNLLKGTKNSISKNYSINYDYVENGKKNAAIFLKAYNTIGNKSFSDLGFKIGDRINIQYKVRVSEPGITKSRFIPQFYINSERVGSFLYTVDFDMDSTTNISNWDVGTSTSSKDYYQKVSHIILTDNIFNEPIALHFRIDIENKQKGNQFQFEIFDVMLWSGDLWTEYTPAVEDYDPTTNEKFQEVIQTVDIYKRTLGENANGITTNISQIIQNSSEIRSLITNVSAESTNLIMDTDTFASANVFGFSNGVNGYSVSNYPGQYGSSNYYYLSKSLFNNTKSNSFGFVSLPLSIDKMENNETYTFSCSLYIDTTNEYSNDSFFLALQIVDTEGRTLINESIISENGTKIYKEFVKTFKVSGDHKFNNIDIPKRFPFRIRLQGEGKIGIKDIMLVKSSNKGLYKPAGGVASTVVIQQSNSWSARRLNSAGDIVSEISLNTNARIKGKNIVLDGDVIANGTAFIKESWIENLNASKITAGEINANKVKIINIDANNIVSGTMNASRIRGGELRALNDATVFNLEDGTLNLYSNSGTIRRIDETSSSQFIKMTRNGFIAERFRDPKAAMIVLGTNHDKSEDTNNETFSGLRLWSGQGNGHKESFLEVVSDRIAFYSNGRYRSPWLLHNNTRDGSTYFIPMNEQGVKHFLGRGDKHFKGVYTDSLFIGTGSTDVGTYLWDLLTCFGVISKYGWNLGNSSVQTHIRGVLNSHGFR